MEEKMITIPLSEYIHLCQKEAELDLLENGGVDNWDWYGESLNPDGRGSYDKIMDEVEKEILKKCLTK